MKTPKGMGQPIETPPAHVHITIVRPDEGGHMIDAFHFDAAGNFKRISPELTLALIARTLDGQLCAMDLEKQKSGAPQNVIMMPGAEFKGFDA